MTEDDKTPRQLGSIDTPGHDDTARTITANTLLTEMQERVTEAHRGEVLQLLTSMRLGRAFYLQGNDATNPDSIPNAYALPMENESGDDAQISPEHLVLIPRLPGLWVAVKMPEDPHGKDGYKYTFARDRKDPENPVPIPMLYPHILNGREVDFFNQFGYHDDPGRNGWIHLEGKNKGDRLLFPGLARRAISASCASWGIGMKMRSQLTDVIAKAFSMPGDASATALFQQHPKRQ